MNYPSEDYLRKQANVEPCYFCEDRYGSKNYQLGTFKGYTVDFRVRQFRKILRNGLIEFIDFTEPKGLRLVYEMHETVMEG